MLSTPTYGGSLLRESTQETTRRGSIDEDTRRRAHEIYLSRKAVPGNELDDWLRAEREIESLAHQAATGKTQNSLRKPRSIRAILRFLRLQRAYVSRPMHQRDGTLVFRVGDFMFSDTQLVELMAKKSGTGRTSEWNSKEDSKCRIKT
jgi:Protein of unknown function (DUF2934)